MPIKGNNKHSQLIISFNQYEFLICYRFFFTFYILLNTIISPSVLKKCYLTSLFPEKTVHCWIESHFWHLSVKWSVKGNICSSSVSFRKEINDKNEEKEQVQFYL